MKEYKHILFDLDGTLTDPGEGITNSVAYALRKFGVEVTDRRELYRFIGPPLIDAFREFYGFSEEDSRLALTYYREYFTREGMFENKVIRGIPRLLSSLSGAGYILSVATSKPEPFSVKILEHFRLDGYFELIAGSTLDEKRTDKAEIIEYAAGALGITDKSKVLMIGDRKHDMIGAAKNGIRCAGVTFGYGSREELQSSGADHIFDTPEEIGEFLLDE